MLREYVERVAVGEGQEERELRLGADREPAKSGRDAVAGEGGAAVGDRYAVVVMVVVIAVAVLAVGCLLG
ncbi:hypothetical protein [Streptomyces iakyrus]|uniref:hypothetical protein n=1 Tax=Streptomyces iakyrus TaxID=68219 RepID=UPI003679B69C